MSMDPAMMQSLLAQKLAQSGSPTGGTYGGGTAGPQMQGNVSPLNAAATLAQKAMLVKALQGAQQRVAQPIAQGMLPGTNATMAADPNLAALQMQNPQLNPALTPQIASGAPGVTPPQMPDAVM